MSAFVIKYCVIIDNPSYHQKYRLHLRDAQTSETVIVDKFFFEEEEAKKWCQDHIEQSPRMITLITPRPLGKTNVKAAVMAAIMLCQQEEQNKE